MLRKPRGGIAESISTRLLQGARAAGADYQTILRRYAFERLLYRLDRSRYREDFVVKGGFLFYIWGEEPLRTTQDLDLLGRGSTSPEHIAMAFRELLAQRPPHDDGLRFDPDSLAVEDIRDVDQYGGLRLKAKVLLGKSRIVITVDIGFGDVVVPPPQARAMKPLLAMDEFSVVVYPPEAVIAEKVEAMVRLERHNSRMKDFYDVWVLSRTMVFAGRLLCRALRRTFEQRRTPLPQTVPDCLSSAFFADADKERQWTAFAGRTRLTHLPSSFDHLGVELASFVWPAMQGAHARTVEPSRWPAGGPWA